MYTPVEQCIIRPHERELYSPKEAYPKVAILMHHTSYYDLARDIGLLDQRLKVDDNWARRKFNLQRIRWGHLPIALVWASDVSEEAVNRLMEQYFWGAKAVINIGSAGGIAPGLQIGGEVVGQRAIRNNRTLDNIASAEEEAVSDPVLTEALIRNAYSEHGLQSGTIWSVNNMMYRWEELKAIQDQKPLAIEMEMAALCLTAGWLNFNYGTSHGKLAVGNLFYISDTLPQHSAETWRDSMNNLQSLAEYKREVLMGAIKTLAAIS